MEGPTTRALTPWFMSLPALVRQKELLAARKLVWRGGLLLVRVDRSPGRIMVLCRELWSSVQDQVFLQSPRYETVGPPLASAVFILFGLL